MGTPGGAVEPRGRWRRRALFAGAAFGVATVGQRVGERRDRRRYPPPGRLTYSGGRCLHWVDHGGSGVPIIIETGAGSLALGWSDIASEMASRGHVYSYDRAGMGWSEAGRMRQTRTAADDLVAVIRSIGEPGPWVVVAHSLGGIYARLFQRQNPDLVGGLVLVDSSHEEMLDRIRAEVGRSALAAQLALGLAMSLAPRSILRLFVGARAADRLLVRLVGGSSAEERQRRAALVLTSAFRRSQLVELVRIPAMLRDLRNGDRSLGALPVAVVTAADPAPEQELMARMRPAWVSMQEDLASLSTCSTRVTADTGGHFVHNDDPTAVLAGLDFVLDQVHASAR